VAVGIAATLDSQEMWLAYSVCQGAQVIFCNFNHKIMENFEKLEIWSHLERE
jgi:hypothetical protein